MERILLTLTSSESKRLIGKAVAALPQVRAAFQSGIIFIATSTSSAYVAEELLDIAIAKKGLFTAGVVVPRGFCVTSSEHRRLLQYGYIGVAQGKISMNVSRTQLLEQWLPQMDHDDIFIKGVNAIDSTGLATIALGRGEQGRGNGGTIGSVIGAVTCRGIQLILPAGLEKLVPGSLIDVTSTMSGPFKYAAGLPSGMMPIKGTLITETHAFQVLTGATAIPIAAGGIDGAEGAHTFVVEGPPDAVEQAWKLYKTIKGEPPLSAITMNCDDCKMGCSFHNDPTLIALRNT
jgi:hypothetical protein